MDQSRLIILYEDACSKNFRPFDRRIFCIELTIGKDTNHSRWIPFDKIPATDAYVCHRFDPTCG